jgi:transposase
MIEPTGSPRDAASVLFDLPGYRVQSAVDGLDDQGQPQRVVVIASESVEAGCPVCGVLSERVHQVVRSRLRDVPVAGQVVVWLLRRRYVCAETRCAKRTFTEVTEQVPLRARVTMRLREALLDAVVVSGRAVSEVAVAYGVAWWTTQATVNAAAGALADPDTAPVRWLGIDEHRYRSVRYFRDPGGAWRRYEPWMTTLVDLDRGQVLGMVDGRAGAGVATWLAARTPAWREGVEVVAIDPSAAYRKAIGEQLPTAAVSVDAFHLVKLANDALTAVRQRLVRERFGRRGRKRDVSWANRRLLLRAGNTLSPRALARLKRTFATDDPTGELAAAWGVKEQLRQLLATGSLATAHTEKMRLGAYVLAADTPETTRLWNTVCTWWPHIEVLVVTGVTNAKTEAANTGIKQIKRTGRGYRNPNHYTARILLTSAARTAARTP